jgi:hypothetical protein
MARIQVPEQVAVNFGKLYDIKVYQNRGDAKKAVDQIAEETSLEVRQVEKMVEIAGYIRAVNRREMPEPAGFYRGRRDPLSAFRDWVAGGEDQGLIEFHPHVGRWTADIVRPETVLMRDLDAGDFKKLMLRCCEARKNLANDIGPARIVLINPTGQYLKPIVGCLVRKGLSVDLIIAHPEATDPDDERPDVGHRLGVLEFLWTLPAIVRCDEHCTGSLRVRASGSLALLHAAFFEGAMVATSDGAPLVVDGSHRGHPAVDGRKMIRHGGRHRVRVLLHGHIDFNRQQRRVEEAAANTVPVLSWSRSGGYHIEPGFDLGRPGAFFGGDWPSIGAHQPPKIPRKNVVPPQR